jgi:small-conductance mechanosensitive channel
MNIIVQWFESTGIPIAALLIGGIIVYQVGTLVLGTITKQLVRGRLRKSSKKDSEKRQQTLANLVTGIWRILIAATTTVAIFKQIFPNIDLSPLFAGAGIVGIAIAFGAQALVKDFLTGIFIITENQYRVGDYVLINDADGRVEYIGTRSTVIRDDSGNVHYIPNGSIIHVINKTMGYSKVNFTVSLDATTDLDNAISVINQVGDALAENSKWKSKILSAPQFVAIGTFTGSSVEVRIEGKTQPSDQWSVTAEMRKRIPVVVTGIFNSLRSLRTCLA